MNPGMAPPGSVIITPTDMYAELRHLAQEVHRVGTILDPALAQLRQDVTEQGTRIRVLEGRMFIASGIALTVGTGGGFLLNVLFGG